MTSCGVGGMERGVVWVGFRMAGVLNVQPTSTRGAQRK